MLFPGREDVAHQADEYVYIDDLVKATAIYADAISRLACENGRGKRMTLYFMDGQFTERDGLNISIDDRGYYFGDGVYEVIKVYGGELFTAEEHFNRLFESAAKIKMTIPYTEDN